jgi:hypothetical protein
MADTTTVRDHLLRALHADLVGPFDPESASPEVLPLPPSRWYLTGFLAPEGERDPEDAEAQEELAAGDLDEHDETTVEEPSPKQKRWYPASIGMSVLLPPREAKGVLRAVVSFGRYVRQEIEIAAPSTTALADRALARGRAAEPPSEERDDKPKRRVVWRRLPERRVEVEVPLDAALLEQGIALPASPASSSPAGWRRPRGRGCGRARARCRCSW